MKAAELLLQERMPRQIAVTFPLIEEEGKAGGRVTDIEPAAGRRYDRPDSETPATHMLCNGRYSLMLTAAGSGQARWRTSRSSSPTARPATVTRSTRPPRLRASRR